MVTQSVEEAKALWEKENHDICPSKLTRGSRIGCETDVHVHDNFPLYETMDSDTTVYSTSGTRGRCSRRLARRRGNQQAEKESTRESNCRPLDAGTVTLSRTRVQPRRKSCEPRPPMQGSAKNKKGGSIKDEYKDPENVTTDTTSNDDEEDDDGSDEDYIPRNTKRPRRDQDHNDIDTPGNSSRTSNSNREQRSAQFNGPLDQANRICNKPDVGEDSPDDNGKGKTTARQLDFTPD